MTEATHNPNLMSRRSFLRLAAAGAGAWALSSCGAKGGEERQATPERKENQVHAVTASVFWIGEKPSADNGGITNEETEWDSNPMQTFGGVDEPEGRDFTPRHNTFYFALPAMEFTSDGPVSGARESSPWADQAATLRDNESLFKGRWVRIEHQGQTAFAQWLDTGPFVEDDYDYVFGDAEPSNTEGLGAGIDVSPDVASYLGFSGEGEVTWQFVDEDQVDRDPAQPWNAHPPIDSLARWE